MATKPDFVKWLAENRDKTSIHCYADETLAHFAFDAGAEAQKEIDKNADLVALQRLRKLAEKVGYMRAVRKACKWIIEHYGDDHVIESFKEAMFE